MSHQKIKNSRKTAVLGSLLIIASSWGVVSGSDEEYPNLVTVINDGEVELSNLELSSSKKLSGRIRNRSMGATLTEIKISIILFDKDRIAGLGGATITTKIPPGQSGDFETTVSGMKNLKKPIEELRLTHRVVVAKGVVKKDKPVDRSDRVHVEVGDLSDTEELTELNVGVISTGDPFEYMINAHFGVEKWTKDELSHYEIWDFTCVYPSPGNRFNTWCNLERTLYRILGKIPIISSHDHGLSEGSLTLTHVDWPKGRLDFTIIWTPWNPSAHRIEVMMRFNYIDRSIYLQSFKALGVVKSKEVVEASEYRIPEYTYTIDVPVEMRGFRSKAQKK